MTGLRALVENMPAREKIDVPPFDGSDYSLYPQFESVLRARSQLEASSFPSEDAKIGWAQGKLKDKAARLMNPWTEAYKSDPRAFRMEDMFRAMEVQIGDTERQKKASTQFPTSRQ